MTIQVAASRDHTVFLTKRCVSTTLYCATKCISHLLCSGSVYTCGLNGGYQLGQGSKQTPFLSPTLLRSLKNKEVHCSSGVMTLIRLSSIITHNNQGICFDPLFTDYFTKV